MARRLLLVGILLCALAFAGPADEAAGKPRSKKLWWASVAALSVASAFDAHSSWGKPELNPLLRGADGRFGVRGITVKSALVGGTCALEWLVLRRHSDLVKPATALNTALAGTATGAAVHNHRGASR